MQLSSFVREHSNDLKNIALGVRLLSMDAVLKSRSGHIGLPLGGAEMGTLLYFALMNYLPKNPHWIDRDRFALSAGHGSMLQYALLHFAGFDVSVDDMKEFRQWGSKTPGHPEYGHTEGVECTTGPLGQGLANAVGFALAERMLAARFPVQNSQTSPIDHRTFVIAGDGCLMEGVSGEASSLAGHLKLNRLIVLYDDNNITIDGKTDISFSENVPLRYQSYGWNVVSADGNDFASLAQALEQALALSEQPINTTGPTLVVCRTVPGKALKTWEGQPKVHGNPMSAEDIIQAKKDLGLTDTTPFFVPEACYTSAKKLLAYRTEKGQRWQEETLPQAKAHWEECHGEIAQRWQQHFESDGKILTIPQAAWEKESEKPKAATRVASGLALQQLAAQDPRLVGGSADLAGSNQTTLPDSSFVSAKDFSGRNIHFGVREHAMGAITNGITLHGGLRGYCATFAVFSDYMRPAIRLAALMKVPSLFILTHDSYAVGEDGPTHQPIEHAAALRAIPHLQVLRPADGLETFAAWEAAHQSPFPTALLLTRQDLPTLDSFLKTPRSREAIGKGMSQGAYIVQNWDATSLGPKIVLVASGSEVHLCLQAAQALTAKNINAQVVSVPAVVTLLKNPILCRTLIPPGIPVVACEAGVSLGWGSLLHAHAAVVSLETYGASAPYTILAEHFGFTPKHIEEVSLRLLETK
jgi:transketolase